MRLDDGVPGQAYVANPASHRQERGGLRRLPARGASRHVGDPRCQGHRARSSRAIGKSFDIGGLDNIDLAKRDLAANAESWTAKGRDESAAQRARDLGRRPSS